MKTDHADGGFSSMNDRATARRQFQLSTVIVAGLAVAIAAAALAMPRLSVSSPAYYTVSVPSTTLHAERDRHRAVRS